MSGPGGFDRPVLVAGLPRSGTTWIGRVLGLTTGAVYVHEPDNHLVRPDAWWAKQSLGPYPALDPGDEAGDYERLWRRAFAGFLPAPLVGAGARALHRCVPRIHRQMVGRATGEGAGPALMAGLRLASALASAPREAGRSRRTVVKSVFCARSLEWLSARFGPEVVVVVRHPFRIISSWAALGWDSFLDDDPASVARSTAAFGVAPPGPDGRWIDRAAWHYGFLASTLEEATARHPAWRIVRHEDLCADPEAGFRRLCRGLGLEWGAEAERFLLESNRPGRGYSTNRLWADQIRPAGDPLDAADQERVLEMLARFAARRPRPGRQPANLAARSRS